VYSLGVVAFAALTGRPPRPVASLAELITASGTAAPPVSSAAPDLGPAFDAAVGFALAPDPDERPDALSFASGLASALGQWTRDGGPSRRSTYAPAPSPALSRAPGPISGGDSLVAIAHSPAWDPASAERAANVTAIPEAATTVIPVDATGVYPAFEEPTTGARRTGSSRPGRTAVLAALILIPTIAVLGLVGSALRSGPGTVSGTPSTPISSIPASLAPSASASASPAASPSTSAPSASSDPAVDALNALGAAIGNAKGGPDGIKGKDANDLERRVGDVRRALDAGDRRAALDAAEKLDKRIHDLGKAGASLREASANLIQALGG
jgi:hypothetical protein